MASSKITFPSVVLALRLLALALLAGSIALIVTNKVSVDLVDVEIFSLSFKDIYAYRYVLGIAVVGCAYTLLQIPLAGVAIAKRSKVIGGTANVALFLICADVVISVALATGAGACFGLSYDAKRFFDGQYDEQLDGATKARADYSKLLRDVDRFFVHGYAAAVLVLLAAKSVAAVVLITVYALIK
ncbi:CASP-like protein 4D1 [Brachypodium distachyon]|uniref:CASP-like protein n=1 Tax=Brachypodium distachyon TaxID=15368 RepID=A0A2K2CN82_BRADI|nr:CASP-like protein 4D1 [Brachypodium distachyon]PNT63482.1 hypothetical protein BRADI_4g16565v3 [Brachypodium distachyon]|eukprot:XP_024310764.1 CASP-like protein 4D1 [Brachypodium distachyon]